MSCQIQAHLYNIVVKWVTEQPTTIIILIIILTIILIILQNIGQIKHVHLMMADGWVGGIKTFPIHPEGEMNICRRFHCDPSSSWDIVAQNQKCEPHGGTRGKGSQNKMAYVRQPVETPGY